MPLALLRQPVVTLPALRPQPVTRVYTMPQVSAARRLLHTASEYIPVAPAPLSILQVSIAVVPESTPVVPVSLPIALAPLLIVRVSLHIVRVSRHTAPVLYTAPGLHPVPGPPIAPALPIRMYQAGPTMEKNNTPILPGPPP